MDPIEELAKRASLKDALVRSYITLLALGWMMACIAYCTGAPVVLAPAIESEPAQEEPRINEDEDCPQIAAELMAKLSSFPSYQISWRAHLLDEQSRVASAEVAGEEGRSPGEHWLRLFLPEAVEASHPIAINAELMQENDASYVKPIGQIHVYRIDERHLPKQMPAAAVADPFGISGLEGTGSFAETLQVLAKRYNFEHCQLDPHYRGKFPIWTFEGVASLPSRVDAFFASGSVRLQELVWHCGAQPPTAGCTPALEAARREITGRNNITLKIASSHESVSWLLFGPAGPWASVETTSIVPRPSPKPPLPNGMQSMESLIKNDGAGLLVRRLRRVFRSLTDTRRVMRARRTLEEVLQ